jgi:predicted small metal-binding protein
VVAEFDHLQKEGYGSVYFVDDHFLLQPKRIEAICNGIQQSGVTIQWGCEGRVDSVAQHLFPSMAKANCRTIMFGIESGSQMVLDRLKKEQTLGEIETAVTNAKNAGIEIVHGFFVVGSPSETVSDIRATFDFAARLRLDTFGFNRLCVYRGTPLWQEYVKRGLVDDKADWYKYFKCSEIDPTCLAGEVINRERTMGFRRLFLYKILHYPKQTARLLRRFIRFMPLRDVVYLIVKPFLGVTRGPTRNEVLSRAVEHPALKDAAGNLTQVADDLLAHVMSESRAERLRIQDDAEPTGRLTDDPDLDRRVVTEIALSPPADPSAKQRATR